MNITERAETLIQALPYIQKYHNRIVVIKYGGSVLSDEALNKSAMSDITLLSKVGVKVVLVHGGGKEINELLSKLNIETKFINGLRQTGKEEAELIQMVLSGKINKNLVRLLGLSGSRAMGLSGVDDKLITAEKMSDELGYVGKINGINTEPILTLLDKGYIPVISSVGCDDDGNIYNINADTVAAHIAGALKASGLILMTDTKGILLDKNDESSLITELTAANGRKMLENGAISGGMIPKLECCLAAADMGVEKVFVLDGRLKHSIIIEMLTDEGVGTMVRR